jgi:hypothetical protein
MTRDAQTLAMIGVLLWGPHWQTPMAAALAVSDRSVRYWVEGRTIPDGIWNELAAICRQRAGDLTKMADMLAAPG